MLKRATHIIPLLIGIILAAVISAGYLTEQERHTQKTRLQVFYELSTIQSGFEKALNSRLSLANALKSFICLNPDIDQKHFSALAKGLTTDVNGIRFLELARGNTITHVYPEKGADHILGRKLLKDFPDDIKELTLKSMKTRQGQIAAPRAIPEGGKAIIAATPVYTYNENLNGSEDYWGLIGVLIDANALYREAGLTDASPGLELALRKPETNNNPSTMLLGKESLFDMNPVILNIPISDGYWQMAAIPTEGWPPSPNRPYIIGGGMAGIFMIMASLWAALFMIQGRLKEREKYQRLVQTAKSIILRINMAGDITFCNEHAADFYGFEPNELIGQPVIGTIIPKKNLHGEPMKRFINRLLKNPPAHPFNENINVRKNGEIVWVAWTNEPILDSKGQMVELLSVGTDITDRKLMEEALRQREKQYRLLAENVTDIIWGLDTDSRLTFISPSDETLRGFKRSDVLGRPINDFLTPVSQHRLTEALDILKSQADIQAKPPSTILDLEFTCSDGSTVWLENRLGIIFNDEDERIGVQSVARDITDRKLAEALRDDVERMARHDLRTPLGAVVGLPEEIRRLGTLTTTQESMLFTIEDAGNTMLQLINRSLDLFKMERGTYSLKKKPVDVLQVLERIKIETLPVIREKGISVGIDVPGNLTDEHFWATVEIDLFKSMLSNLILNAMQASPESGSVSVTLQRGDDITIIIRNQGEIQKSIRDTFFDKYSSSNGSSGSGLGTYSARLIARTHGGDITADTSTPGETSIIVTLPN
ncbi:MAG: PAS domain S-box protein [Pseudodesulfovibrio sp.]|nr:PAS domain S-box protein [Pseudodesulfovibrio sp.]